MKAMGTLPHDKQLQVASGFRVMADRFKLALQEILTSRGAGAIRPFRYWASGEFDWWHTLHMLEPLD